MNLGENIKKIRHLKGFKQEEMAQKLSITPQAYSKIECGHTQIDVNRLEEIAKIFELSTEEIKGFDSKSFFVNNLHDCTDSTSSAASIINHNYYGENSNATSILEKLVEQQKEEILFLRQQILFWQSQNK